MINRQTLALALFGVPTALLLGALAFQYVGGLPPCELCLQQRWPLLIAIVFAAAGLFWLRAKQSFARLSLFAASLGLIVSAGIGFFHSGVERKWWPGPGCSSTIASGLSPADYLKQLESAAVVNCSDIPWSLFGLSMANYNVIISGVVGVLGIYVLLMRWKTT